jgi:glycyl-tRNA synthetase
MANIPVNKTAHPFDKTRFEALLNRRFFYAPAFEIYGGAYGHALSASSFIHLYRL